MDFSGVKGSPGTTVVGVLVIIAASAAMLLKLCTFDQWYMVVGFVVALLAGGGLILHKGQGVGQDGYVDLPALVLGLGCAVCFSVFIFALVLSFSSGCCSFDANKQAAVKSSLTLLQAGYDTSVGYLADPGNQMIDAKTKAGLIAAQAAAKIAVPLVDMALDQLGQVQASQCPDPNAVTKALLDAQLAQKAQQEALALAAKEGVAAPPAPAVPTVQK